MFHSLPAWLSRLALASLACLAFITAQAQTPPRATALLRVPDAARPIQVRHVQVDTQVVGLAAQTRIELEFFNPNTRVLEGELQFPLRQGQTVAGFALDIDGELRPAVPVDKAKGRQVFEDVTRARVDPALLEATTGSNYKLRVYPLPAQGTRRVVLQLAETLSHGGALGRTAASFTLPLAFGTQRLEVQVRLARTRRAQAPSGSVGAQPLALHVEPGGAIVLAATRSGYTGGDTLRVRVPLDDEQPSTVAQAHRDSTYFYAEVPTASRTRLRPAPRSIAVVWDASGSGQQRDHGREFLLLDALFQAVRNVDVQLVVVRDSAEAPQRFTVAGGDWHALRDHLRSVPYDGATRLDLMAVPQGAELALLFSDGLSTYGEGGLPRSSVPLFAVQAAGSADAVLLRHAAEESAGELLDLTQADPAAAAREVLQERTRLVGLEAAGAGDLLFDSRYAQDGRFFVAGRMTQPRAQVTLELQAPDGTRSVRTVTVTAAAARGVADGLPIAAYRWSAMQLAALNVDRDRHREEIRRIGAQFGVVTAGTSLVVLDAVADYVGYGIEPPPSLRAEYDRLLAQRGRRRDADRQAQIERVVSRFSEKQAWYDRDFPKGAPPMPMPMPSEAERRAAALAAREREERESRSPPRMAAAPAPAPAPAPVQAAPMARLMATAPPQVQATPDAGASAATIALRRWEPDAPYTRRLRAAAPEAMYAIYLDERPGYANSTAFFLDAADIFLERGQRALGLRILSNLAEMDLENRQILRILAYRLQQAGQLPLALPMLRKVLALAPDEPQSERDLGLALSAAGRDQEAIEHLWEVISRPWGERFPDIELVALAELDATVARHARTDAPPLDLARIDPRLPRNLPLDLRAVLAWDTDNTDIDLHVIDPNGEEAFYGHQLTYQGGRMSRDFTGGYGPEEFSLRIARPGTYTVKAQFYGHRQQILSAGTTLMLHLTTGFGTAAQRDQDVVLRLSGEGREVVVGTFDVAAPWCAEAASGVACGAHTSSLSDSQAGLAGARLENPSDRPGRPGKELNR